MILGLDDDLIICNETKEVKNSAQATRPPIVWREVSRPKKLQIAPVSIGIPALSAPIRNSALIWSLNEAIEFMDTTPSGGFL
jgi:hypothetical protein